MQRVRRAWSAFRYYIAWPLARLAFFIAPRNAEGQKTAHVAPGRTASVAHYGIHRWVGKTYWVSYSGGDAIAARKEFERVRASSERGRMELIVTDEAGSRCRGVYQGRD
jgi:hypothetical protein